jgi:hypothetical protein
MRRHALKPVVVAMLLGFAKMKPTLAPSVQSQINTARYGTTDPFLLS